jgi:hypothetical protein
VRSHRTDPFPLGNLKGKIVDRSAEYEEGQEAARQGLTDADCPYPIGSDEAMDWQDGLASDQ